MKVKLSNERFSSERNIFKWIISDMGWRSHDELKTKYQVLSLDSNHEVLLLLKNKRIFNQKQIVDSGEIQDIHFFLFGTRLMDVPASQCSHLKRNLDPLFFGLKHPMRYPDGHRFVRQESVTVHSLEFEL